MAPSWEAGKGLEEHGWSALLNLLNAEHTLSAVSLRTPHKSKFLTPLAWAGWAFQVIL